MKFIKWIIKKIFIKIVADSSNAIGNYKTIFAQKVVRYDLYVKDTIVNFTGKEKGQ